jgi:hypothetical protein
MLRFLYEHKWHTATADMKVHNENPVAMSAQTLTAIGVYGLADKYEIEGLRACALDKLPPPLSRTSPYVPHTISMTDIREIIDAHYSQYVKGNCPMGRKICLSIIKWTPNNTCQATFMDLAKKHTSLAEYMYFASCDNGGRLW